MPGLHIEFTDETEPFMNAIYSICAMHVKKAKDYGSDGSPYHNIEACEDMGIPAWVGITLRMNDKEVRIRNFLKRGHLANESVRDSIHDNAVYGILRLMEYDRAQGVEAQTTQAVCKDHKFNEFAVCRVCGYSAYKTVSPESPDYSNILAADLEPRPRYAENHHWYNDICDRCGLIRVAYDHAKKHFPSSILTGELCEVKEKQHRLNAVCSACMDCGVERDYFDSIRCIPGMGKMAPAPRYNSMGASTDD